MDQRNLYEVLGVSKLATDSEIQERYNKLKDEFNPEKDEGHLQQFNAIQRAFEVLSDPEQRRVYDFYGEKSYQENKKEDYDEESDIFNSVFGNTSTNTQFSRRVPEIIIKLQVTLEDIYEGIKVIPVEYTRTIICVECYGLGAPSSVKKTNCTDCNGKGTKQNTASEEFLNIHNFINVNTKCETCKGRGIIINDDEVCSKCMGERIINEEKSFDFQLEKGMHHMQKIPFRCEGNQIVDGSVGDVILLIFEKPHELFRRNYNDLIIHDIKINLLESLTGFVYIFKYLNGKQLVVKSTPGEIIKPGACKVILGKGMPIYTKPDENGNLYLYFNIEFPPSNYITDENLKELETILPPRVPFEMPVGENVDIVDLIDLQPDYANQKEWFQDMEEDNFDRNNPRIQCTTQ